MFTETSTLPQTTLPVEQQLLLLNELSSIHWLIILSATFLLIFLLIFFFTANDHSADQGIIWLFGGIAFTFFFLLIAATGNSLSKYNTLSADFRTTNFSQRLEDVFTSIKANNKVNIEVIRRFKFCLLNDRAVLNANNEAETFLCILDDTRSANNTSQGLDFQHLNYEELKRLSKAYRYFSESLPAGFEQLLRERTPKTPMAGEFYKQLNQK